MQTGKGYSSFLLLLRIYIIDFVVNNSGRMFLQVVLFGVFSGVVGQALIDLEAYGATSTGAASAIAQGFGQKVDGEALVVVTDSSASSSAVVTATGGKGKDDKNKGGSKPKPRPQPTPKAKPQPQPYPYPYHQIVPSKQYKDPVCEDIKDDKCYSIDEYYYCGFCVLQAYPLKGYACKYSEEKVPKKKGSSSKKVYDYDYDTVIVPHCDCGGDFILEGEKCPGCDDILAALLQCAGIKDPKKEALEIPEQCLKSIGVSVDVLTKCGFLHPPTYSKKEKEYDPKKIVVIKDDKKDAKKYPVIRDDKKDAKKYPVIVHTPSVATANAYAMASGGGSAIANAYASAGGR
eukprot:TRINITY_DN1683_c0_g1_i1.p1 TRINITY_DN1683_c0_g1~~TRINITY_DN1683_c0_g1_i1.p1  ORF type:complete len:346 (-),score=86.14 TRINITY_DN1683_c0_g1_i1:458-1495(-)